MYIICIYLLGCLTSKEKENHFNLPSVARNNNTGNAQIRTILSKKQLIKWKTWFFPNHKIFLTTIILNLGLFPCDMLDFPSPAPSCHSQSERELMKAALKRSPLLNCAHWFKQLFKPINIQSFLPGVLWNSFQPPTKILMWYLCF